MSQCPRCFYHITKKDKVCPKCKYPLADVIFEEDEQELKQKEEEKKISKRELKRQEKQRKKEEKKARLLALEEKKTDFVALSKPIEGQSLDVLKENKKKKLKNPQFNVDENGEFDIDTKDVEIVGDENGKFIENQFKQTYSVKKARGDYHEPKIHWWELYKLADRAFARRKIKKEVAKASKIKPEFINKTKLFFLALFLGWIGAHNFYAKNKKKGWLSLICFIIQVTVLELSYSVYFFSQIRLSVCGSTGFVVLFIWVTDTVNIIFNNFSYRFQKDSFIENMNVKTRAKLGEKYIDLELYKKPWWVRFKVWLSRQKRNYDEWKHDRRQRLIEKEKAKLEKQKQQNEIDREVQAFENKENSNIDKIKSQIDTNTISEVKSLSEEKKIPEKLSKPRTPKKSFGKSKKKK